MHDGYCKVLKNRRNIYENFGEGTRKQIYDFDTGRKRWFIIKSKKIYDVSNLSKWIPKQNSTEESGVGAELPEPALSSDDLV
jgi:hypothetical protein